MQTWHPITAVETDAGGDERDRPERFAVRGGTADDGGTKTPQRGSPREMDNAAFSGKPRQGGKSNRRAAGIA